MRRARQAHAELYMGLVETGVGLLPGGGGCKEMTLHAIDAAASVREGGRSESVELLEALRRNFETIAMAKVSTSAAEARQLGFLTPSDRITMNRDGCDGRQGRGARHRPGRIRRAAAAHRYSGAGRESARHAETGRPHDARGRIHQRPRREGGHWVAYVLCGGKITPGTPVSEQYLLDLEREAFLSLCGEKKTQERIAFTLKTGKPLRN